MTVFNSVHFKGGAEFIQIWSDRSVANKLRYVIVCLCDYPLLLIPYNILIVADGCFRLGVYTGSSLNSPLFVYQSIFCVREALHMIERVFLI